MNISNIIQEEIDSFNNSDYLKWKRNNVTLRGIRVAGTEQNGGGAMLGRGLYTAFLGNKSLAKEYGSVYFVVGAIPKKPVVVKSLNEWEIFMQYKLIKRFCQEHGEDYDPRYFHANTSIEGELMKMGYDGAIIKGREIVNYTPSDKVRYFENEDALRNYYQHTLHDKLPDNQHNKIEEEQISKLANIKKHYSKYLYHSTNIKNLNTIQAHGLLPEFGDTIKQAYSGSYKFDKDEKYDDDDYDQPQELDFDGILFFSEKPLIGFSQTMQGSFKWEEALLCIIEKNDSIYHKVDDQDNYTDYMGNKQHAINHVNVYDLPIFIETNDWFSFDEQECKYLLYGDKLKYFIQTNFPEIFNRYSNMNESANLNEQVYKVYHGTNQEFTKFNLKLSVQGIVWFTDSIDSIKNGEHGGNGSKYIMTRYITINKPAGWDEYEKYGLGQLENMGYDGVILPQGDKTDYFVFSTRNIRVKP